MAKIVETYNFLQFCKDNFVPPLKRGEFENKKTKEKFPSLMGKLKKPIEEVDPETGEITIKKFQPIHFSSKMDHPLSTAEVARDAEQLIVCEMDSGSYILAYESPESWEDVPLKF